MAYTLIIDEHLRRGANFEEAVTALSEWAQETAETLRDPSLQGENVAEAIANTRALEAVGMGF